jgi:hypothetical protein
MNQLFCGENIPTFLCFFFLLPDSSNCDQCYVAVALVGRWFVFK